MNGHPCHTEPINAKLKFDFHNNSYTLLILISQQVFNNDYPVNPKTFGERLQKARMNAGLQIKKLAAIVGVTENTEIVIK